MADDWKEWGETNSLQQVAVQVVCDHDWRWHPLPDWYQSNKCIKCHLYRGRVKVTEVPYEEVQNDTRRDD